ncbi:hypothetical protein LCGC14_2781080 [marine sediment metagenome]|uniref:Uncharacterized protein n=1 Tax=marine sediment metagenome TaxID=412755 RepID=A0A0F8YT92_9ZZZZ
MTRYKLTVVEDEGLELYGIGMFNDEQELENWANQNTGELKRAENDAELSDYL